MFLISLPNNQTTGDCKINGKPAKYRPHADKIEFRSDGETVWQERHILEQHDCDSVVDYFCDDGPGSEGPYVIVNPGAPEPEPTENLTEQGPVVERIEFSFGSITLTSDQYVVEFANKNDPACRVQLLLELLLLDRNTGKPQLGRALHKAVTAMTDLYLATA